MLTDAPPILSACEQTAAQAFVGLGISSPADLELYLGRRWSSTYDRVIELKPANIRGFERQCVCGSHITHSAKGALRVGDLFVARGKCLKRVLDAAHDLGAA